MLGCVTFKQVQVFHFNISNAGMIRFATPDRSFSMNPCQALLYGASIGPLQTNSKWSILAGQMPLFKCSMSHECAVTCRLCYKTTLSLYTQHLDAMRCWGGCKRGSGTSPSPGQPPSGASNFPKTPNKQYMFGLMLLTAIFQVSSFYTVYMHILRTFACTACDVRKVTSQCRSVMQKATFHCCKAC